MLPLCMYAVAMELVNGGRYSNRRGRMSKVFIAVAFCVFNWSTTTTYNHHTVASFEVVESLNESACTV